MWNEQVHCLGGEPMTCPSTNPYPFTDFIKKVMFHIFIFSEEMSQPHVYQKNYHHRFQF